MKFWFQKVYENLQYKIEVYEDIKQSFYDSKFAEEEFIKLDIARYEGKIEAMHDAIEKIKELEKRYDFSERRKRYEFEKL